MGYSTEFRGAIKVSPPLTEQERQYLLDFSKTCHKERKGGPYALAAKATGFFAYSPAEEEKHKQLTGQPGQWCNWIPNEDGTAIVWNGAEKFYDSVAWMIYLIEHFIGPHPKAKRELKFLRGHRLDGVILAQGDDMMDRWELVVEDSNARRRRA